MNLNKKVKALAEHYKIKDHEKLTNAERYKAVKARVGDKKTVDEAYSEVFEKKDDKVIDVKATEVKTEPAKGTEVSASKVEVMPANQKVEVASPNFTVNVQPPNISIDYGRINLWHAVRQAAFALNFAVLGAGGTTIYFLLTKGAP